jgi:hypothetical protein
MFFFYHRFPQIQGSEKKEEEPSQRSLSVERPANLRSERFPPSKK